MSLSFLPNLRRRSSDRMEYALAVTVGGELIGEAGLRLVSTKDADAFLFFTLKRDKWGRGYAAEAARLAVDFGFTTLGLHRIWARSHPENAGSRRILEGTIGMLPEGRLRECVRATTGQWFDMDLFAILESDPPRSLAANTHT